MWPLKIPNPALDTTSRIQPTRGSSMEFPATFANILLATGGLGRALRGTTQDLQHDQRPAGPIDRLTGFNRASSYSQRAMKEWSAFGQVRRLGKWFGPSKGDLPAPSGLVDCSVFSRFNTCRHRLLQLGQWPYWAR
jgi:hypothetical protein